MVDTILGIQEEFAGGGFDLVTGDVERLSGKAPRSLEEVLKAALSSGAGA